MIRCVSILLCALLLSLAGNTGAASQSTGDSSLKLYVFDCGMIRFSNIEPFSIANDETDVRDLIVPCYVIEHESGRLLWDGGLPSDVAEADGWKGEGMKQRLDRTLAQQLAEISLDMDSFNFIAFSHFHFDHVGVANEIERGVLIIQQAEYDAAFAETVTLPGADPALYDSWRNKERLHINGDHDVFGDGSVRIISAPGHTPGHQVLFIDLENTGPIVLSGDLYHFAISRRERRVPTFNTDAGETLVSMDRVENLLEETGAELWIEHELAHFEQLETVPAFYD